MVAQYVSLIRDIQPHGPYRLLGWSLGGVLAHEAAVQLQAAGERVDVVAVLDTDLVPEPELVGTPVPEEFLRYQEETDAAIDEGIAELTAGDPAEVPALSVLSTEEKSMVANAQRYHLQIRPRYSGNVFDGDLLLVRATADKSVIVSPELTWRAYVTGTIDELHVDCTHYQLLDMAALAGLAQSETKTAPRATERGTEQGPHDAARRVLAFRRS